MACEVIAIAVGSFSYWKFDTNRSANTATSRYDRGAAVGGRLPAILQRDASTTVTMAAAPRRRRTKGPQDSRRSCSSCPAPVRRSHADPESLRLRWLCSRPCSRPRHLPVLWPPHRENRRLRRCRTPSETHIAEGLLLDAPCEQWSPVVMRSTISSRKSSTSLALYPSLNRTVVNVLDVMASALIMTDPVCRWISRASTLLSPRLLELRLWKQH